MEVRGAGCVYTPQLGSSRYDEAILRCKTLDDRLAVLNEVQPLSQHLAAVRPGNVASR